MSPNILFWLAFFRMFSSTVRSLISLKRNKNVFGEREANCRHLEDIKEAWNSPSPVYVDVPGLTDAMAAVLGLCVHGGVPVAVVEHNRVGSCEVYAYAAAAS